MRPVISRLISYLRLRLSVGLLTTKFDEAIAETTNAAHKAGHLSLSLADVDEAARSTTVFMLVWMTIGIAAPICFVGFAFTWGSYTSADNANKAVYQANQIIGNVVQSVATTPTLGAILFTLSLDVSRARNKIEVAHKAAQTKSLTLAQYRETAKYTNRIDASWRRLLYVLGVTALYNTLGCVIYLDHNSNQATADDDGHTNSKLSFKQYVAMNCMVSVSFSKLLVCLLIEGTTCMVLIHHLFPTSLLPVGKEAMLFFRFLYQARIVNDSADDVATEMFTWAQELAAKEEDEDDDEEEDDEEMGEGSEGMPLVATDEGVANVSSARDGAVRTPQIETETEMIAQLREDVKRLSQRLDVRDKRRAAAHSRLTRAHLRLSLFLEGVSSQFELTPFDRRRRTKNMRPRLLADQPSGIRFRVLGIRWTTRYVQALTVSFLLSVFFTFIHNIQESAEEADD